MTHIITALKISTPAVCISENSKLEIDNKALLIRIGIIALAIISATIVTVLTLGLTLPLTMVFTSAAIIAIGTSCKYEGWRAKSAASVNQFMKQKDFQRSINVMRSDPIKFIQDYKLIEPSKMRQILLNTLPDGTDSVISMLISSTNNLLTFDIFKELNNHFSSLNKEIMLNLLEKRNTAINEKIPHDELMNFLRFSVKLLNPLTAEATVEFVLTQYPDDFNRCLNGEFGGNLKNKCLKILFQKMGNNEFLERHKDIVNRYVDKPINDPIFLKEVLNIVNLPDAIRSKLILERIKLLDDLDLMGIPLKPTHMTRPVIGIDIPNADPNISLRDLKDLFTSIGFVGDIDDDGTLRSIADVQEKFNQYIEGLASGFIIPDRYGHEITQSLLYQSKNILRHLIHYMHHCANPEHKKDIIKRIAITFFHCSARMGTEFKDLYGEYVVSNANLVADAATVENRLLMHLHSFREKAISEASIVRDEEWKHLPKRPDLHERDRKDLGDKHPAATHRFVRANLGYEFGVADVNAAADHAWASYSYYKFADLDVVRDKFNQTYQTKSLVENLQTNFVPDENQKKVLPYQCFANYFTDREVGEGELWNEEFTEIKKGSILFFLEQQEII